MRGITSPRRARAGRIAAGAILLALGGAAAELVLRVAGFGEPPLATIDPHIEYYPTPGATYRRFGNIISINRHGMRSDDWEGVLPHRAQHVALLGDSVVYGTHDLDQQETLAAQLQSLLREHDPQMLVSAMAASSWGPANLLEFYRRRGPFPGSCAILVLSTHDLEDHPTFVRGDVPYRLRAPRGALHDAMLVLRQRMLPARRSEGAAVSGTERRRLTAQALEALLRVLQRDFDRVVVVFHAEAGELTTAIPPGEQQISAIAGQQGAGFLTLRPHYLQAVGDGSAVHSDGLHLTRDGNSLVAGVLAQQIGAGAPTVLPGSDRSPIPPADNSAERSP